jgi:3-hexulose-6-phosphate synthase
MKVCDLKLPTLQVALDFTSLNEALKLLSRISDLDIGIVEVGTPLIKSEGVKAVTAVKSVVANTPVLADTKTVDVGGLEAEVMLRAGADFVTLLAVADDPVIEAALRVARGLDGDVVVDFISFRGDIFERVSELMNIGVRAINIHIGIDVQRARGVTAASVRDIVRRISSEFTQAVIFVSGGIKPADIPSLLDAGAHVLVIGGAITRAPDPREAARECLRAVGRRI